jgi:hypothetical protein
MFPKGFPMNPGELPISARKSSKTAAKGNRRRPMKVGNRRASERSGHGTHFVGRAVTSEVSEVFSAFQRKPADGYDTPGSGSRLEMKVDTAGEIRNGDFRAGLVDRKERFRGIELIGARTDQNLYVSGFRQNTKIEPVYTRPDQFAVRFSILATTTEPKCARTGATIKVNSSSTPGRRDFIKGSPV